MNKIISKNKYLSFKQSGLYLLLGFGIILGILYLSLLKAKNKMAENLLAEKMDLVELKMSDFFSTVEKAFDISYKRGKLEEYNDCDFKKLNRQFIPVLEGFEAISSVGIGNEHGKYYFLEQREGLFENMIIKDGSQTSKPQKYECSFDKNELNLVKKEKLDDLYDPRLRPWYIGAVNSEEKAVFWTKPYQFTTSSIPGITISKKWINKKGIQHVMAFDLSILDISSFTSQMEISAHGKAFIVGEDGRFLGLPKDKRFQEQKELLNYLLKDTDSLGIPEIVAAKREVTRHSKRKELYSFHFKRERYFLKVKPFMVGNNTFRICLLIPEKDLTDNVQMIVWLVVIIILVIALMAILTTKAYQSKQNANQLLLTQKKVLEEKNREIKASILYAKHLQEAILPSSSMIKNLFPQSFILYKPRDIVSGDFYWKHSFDRMVYFAVADCTGHGVPGAMVSVVCANSLNLVIKEYGIIEPGKVLDLVRDQVVDAFSQSEDGVSDGMDIALCCIDLEINKLWYSGANNALYRVGKMTNEVDALIKVVSDTNRGLYEYPATRQPIGKVTETEKFKTYEIELGKGDSIYLFSDGFADQFGGPKGKKYKSKPFKNFLLSISEKSMEEQQMLLEKEFEVWKGDEEQVDDICILGVKI